MKHIVTTQNNIEDAAAALEAEVKAHGFGVLHTYNLKEILNSKGIDFAQECRIFEICNPVQASKVLAEDMDLNMALPCRISVWQAKDGKVKIGMISPKAMLASLSDSPVLQDIATEVEDAMKAMMTAAQ